ncbi:BTAD domain-containing putative transcriptional regulator [Micromonospora sp. CA-259024]|uniref:AfsR/SARP family transcriptional regulator n=1 Tax=Micromonospora sp. CA-259024 TaxID=3239965 RepID=UPI003D8BEE4C
MRAWRQGREIPVGPPKQRAVLGLLASRVNDVVGFEEIIDAVWGSSVPPTAANGVHTYIARLRRLLEPGRTRREAGEVLVSTGGGYALFMESDDLDVARFDRLVREARVLRGRSEFRAAEETLGNALRLWRGEAYQGLPGTFAEVERARLNESRLTATEGRAQLLLDLGQPAEAAAVLSDAVATEPLRERLRGLLMRALYRSGRQADALCLYRQTRKILRDELGIEPHEELRHLQHQILSGSADAPAPARASAPVVWADVPRPAQLPPRTRAFTGRRAELAQLRKLMGHAGSGPTVIAVVEGTAGVGKTALVVDLAHEMLPRFPDGQIFLDMRGSHPDRPPLTAGEALGLLLGGLGVDRDRIPADLAGRIALYRSMLHGRRILIVLDDGADADQLRPLIPAGPAGVLITSRRRQSGLAARDGAYRIALRPLDPADSVLLLCRLAGHDRFTGQQHDAVRLTDLCGHLPLALRIAAESLVAEPGLPVGELTRRYGLPGQRLNRLSLAGDASTDLRAGLAASYRALPDDTARMFRLLAHHPGSTIDVAVAAALAGVPDSYALRQLDELVAHHLLDELEGRRYRFFGLLRLYASELSVDPDPGRTASGACRTN